MILGQGSFGPVYKAVMATGEVVAVKALASDSSQGEREFQTEVTHHYPFLDNPCLHLIKYSNRGKATTNWLPIGMSRFGLAKSLALFLC
jgi:hypothetical protein